MLHVGAGLGPRKVPRFDIMVTGILHAAFGAFVFHTTCPGNVPLHSPIGGFCDRITEPFFVNVSSRSFRSD
jgi:hypothetical protein